MGDKCVLLCHRKGENIMEVLECLSICVVTIKVYIERGTRIICNLHCYICCV